MPQVNYGVDLSATTGLDPTFRLVSGSVLMGQVCLRRLYCPLGGLIGQPTAITLDVRDLVGLGMTPAEVSRQESLCEAALEDDERISSASVRIMPDGEGLRVYASGSGALGPFSLVLSVTRVSVQVLTGEQI